jgi:hypothetical protein
MCENGDSTETSQNKTNEGLLCTRQIAGVLHKNRLILWFNKYLLRDRTDNAVS